MNHGGRGSTLEGRASAINTGASQGADLRSIGLPDLAGGWIDRDDHAACRSDLLGSGLGSGFHRRRLIGRRLGRRFAGLLLIRLGGADRCGKESLQECSLLDVTTRVTTCILLRVDSFSRTKNEVGCRDEGADT